MIIGAVQQRYYKGSACSPRLRASRRSGSVFHTAKAVLHENTELTDSEPLPRNANLMHTHAYGVYLLRRLDLACVPELAIIIGSPAGAPGRGVLRLPPAIVEPAQRVAPGQPPASRREPPPVRRLPRYIPTCRQALSSRQEALPLSCDHS